MAESISTLWLNERTLRRIRSERELSLVGDGREQALTVKVEGSIHCLFN